MRKPNNRVKMKESTDPMDLLKMQTEFALLESMSQSKTLTIMVIVMVVIFGGLTLWLFN